MNTKHISAGVEISLRIGQRVRRSDYAGKRVTGVIRGLSVDSDQGLMATITLDAPIVIPALGADDREVSIWNQHVSAHELSPFDERDELMAEMLAALQRAADLLARDGKHDSAWRQVRAAIAKATGA